MNSPNFKFVVFQKDLNKDTIIVNKEVKFNFNNKYLSSDQINKKSKVSILMNNVLNREYTNRPGNVMPPRTILWQYSLTF